MIWTRNAILGLSLLALVVAVAACGSSSKTGSGTATTITSQSSTGSPIKTATGPPITVGLICSCSGAFGGAVVPNEEVYKAWVNTVNASGGIDGHPIQLTTKDDAGNPGTSATDIQALLSAHVDAIVDLSYLAAVWASTVQKAGIPVVGANESDQAFAGNPDFYAEGQTEDAENPSYMEVLKAAGATNFGVMYCVEAPQCAESVAQLKVLGKTDALPLAYSGQISVTAPNYTAQWVAAQQAHVQAVIVEDGQTQIQRVATDCDKQGYDPIYVTGGSSWSESLATAPGLKQNTWDWYPDLPFWVNNSATQAMNAAVDKYYPGLRSNTTLWGEFPAESWPSGLLLEDAVKAGGLGPSDIPTAPEIAKGLNSLKGDTLDGWYSPLTFVTGQAHPQDCWFTARVQNSVPRLVSNGHVTCQNSS